MALDKLVDSAALDASLNYTAGVLNAILLHLAGMDGQTAPPMPYDLDQGTGFGAAILAFTNAHPMSGGSGLTLLRGSVTPAQTVDTLTITPAANRTPALVLLWRDSGSNGSYPVYLSAYVKTPVTVTGTNQPQWAQAGGYSVLHWENGSYGIYTSNVDEGVASSGAITFGVKGNTRRYYAGDTYRWIAVYGEVYD